MCAVPFLWRAWRRRAPLNGVFLLWFAASYGLGAYAAVPNLLRKLGCPEALCSHWLMNVFLLHPLLNRLRPGGMLIGELVIIAILTAQYGGMLLAILRARRAGR